MDPNDLLPLHPIPFSEWEVDFVRLLRDEYLRKKYRRERRVREKFDYIVRNCPEIMRRPSGSGGIRVVDVGPGPGEFLEWARHYGWDEVGIDTLQGDGGMGDGYLALSQLLADRQGVFVSYCGFDSYVAVLHESPQHPDTDVQLFNFQGSWAQCFAEFVSGEPHHVHHDAKLQRWEFTAELRTAWIEAFEGMAKHLVPGGSVLIYANQLGDDRNRAEYDKTLLDVADACGLALTKHEPTNLHKWTKR